VVDSFAVKVAFPTGNGNEHIWVDVISHTGDDITGTIDNNPEFRPDLKDGMTVTVKEANVSDWGYLRDGRLYGNFTTRVLVKHMAPDEAAQVKAMLSETALEPPEK